MAIDAPTDVTTVADGSPANLNEMIRQLTRAGLMRSRVGKNSLPPLKAYLRAWQCQRLATTHADLLESEEFGPACRFFLTDIYAPQDFSQRDADIQRMVGLMRKVLPSEMIRGVVKALDLNDLTHELDEKMIEVLRSELDVHDSFTTEQYEQAYHLCDNYDERMRQIDLIVESAFLLDSAHHLPFAKQALRAARLPARLLGWAELYDFLERGFVAWLPVRVVGYFARTIEQREKAILNRIYLIDATP